MVIIIIVIVVLTLAFLAWCLNATLKAACPNCQQENDLDEVIIPVVPGFRWWCPACGNFFVPAEIAERRREETR